MNTAIRSIRCRTPGFRSLRLLCTTLIGGLSFAAAGAAEPKPMPVAVRLEAAKPRETTSPGDSWGIVFSGSAGDLARVREDMQGLLSAMGWTASQVCARTAADGASVCYSLNSSPADTDTFALSRRSDLGLATEAVAFTDRHGQTKSLALVSQKEILAAMLQRGRSFTFAGPNCSVDKLREHLAIRQNVVFWGFRTTWRHPEFNPYRYNRDVYWEEMQGDDWQVKPGVRHSEAVADAFVGQYSYEIGCTSACRFIVAQGIFDYYQRIKQDKRRLLHIEASLDSRRPFRDMAPPAERLGTGIVQGLMLERHVRVPWNHWVPGDWGWIKNTDEKSSREFGSEGSNIIYAGGGVFVNYYPERPVKNLDQLIKRVYGWSVGLDEEEVALDEALAQTLRKDPRDGGMLRDVRDFPKLFTAPSNAMPPAALSSPSRPASPTRRNGA